MAAPILIKKVDTKKELKEFIRFYNRLYKGNPNFAAPLEFDELSTLSKHKNPSHKTCESSYWLAIRDNKTIGRIAAIISSNEIIVTGKQIGRFGYFDFIDENQVSEKLMQTAVLWLKKQGIKTIHGPFGFTDLDRQGALVKGFDREGTMATIYNHEYYNDHFNKLGFEKSTDWVEYLFDIKDKPPEKLGRIARFSREKFKVKSLKVRTKAELKKYIPEMFALINSSYSDLYGYVPLSQEQIEYYGKNYIGFVKKELVRLIINDQEKLIGVAITMPSFTKALQKANGKLFPFGWYHMLKALNNNKTLDLYLVAIDANYQDKGITAIIMDELYQASIAFGIKQVETNIELEDNHKVQSMWKLFGAEQHKRRRCYIKNI